jgi:lipopolysaccharide/colanic/teichoic acid biosynthesis glycosyltransferase/glycosyltransferase involved in cell wall biosynthesis
MKDLLGALPVGPFAGLRRGPAAPRSPARPAVPTLKAEGQVRSVVHVTTVPTTLGFLKGQIGHLKSQGCDVWAVATPGPKLDAYGEQMGIAVRGVPMARRITPFADLGSVVRLWKIFREIKPDVVHGHTPKGGLLSMIAAALAGVPARFYSVHGLPLETASGWKRKLLSWTERVACFLAHRVHPVSESLSRIVLKEKLCAKSRLFHMGPGTIDGVDAERRFVPNAASENGGRELRRSLGIPLDSPVIGYVGRLVRDKGVHDLLEAWKLLRVELPDAHLIVAGGFEPQDPVSPEYERLLREDPRIHLLGFVESMQSVYAAMDALALPTYREGFPQTPLEAAAMEVPVVATRVTGCVDAVVHGVTGMLVPKRFPRALATALEGYLRNPDLRRRHGQAARKRVLEKFRPKDFWLAMEEGYRANLGSNGTPKPAIAKKFGPRRPMKGRGVELMIKRILDIAGAAAGLAILLPVLILVGLCTWLTLGRPLFFRQTRPGLHGKPFRPFKFRSMRNGTEPDEVRVTRLGKFLRHASLDELPQLWNVLIGDMSLVGPRPLLMDYVRRYPPRIRQRLDMRPGLTGWCQVNGRNSLTWDKKFAYDVHYVENWSLWLDLKILFMTVGKIVQKHGIDGPGSLCWPEELGYDRHGPADHVDRAARIAGETR